MTNEIPPQNNRSVEVDREAMRAPRTMSHGASQPLPLAGFTTPAVPIGFEAAQILLQRTGKQLRIPDQEPGKAKDRVAAFMDQFTRDTVIHARLWNVPLPPDVPREIELMDPKRLAKIVDKLTITPPSIAVRYLMWIHSSLGSEEPNPLDGWLRDLETHIHTHHAKDRPHPLFRAAERQVYIWVGLYVSALLAWIEDYCAAVPLVEITAASLRFGVGRPDLNRQLVERRNRLLEWSEVMEIIEADYLHAPILPDAWRRWLEPVELDAVIVKVLERSGGRAVAKAYDPAECKKRARVKVAVLLETARATADITACYQVILALTKAQLTLTNRRAAWKELSVLLESGEAERGRRKPAQSSPSGSPPAQPKSRSGAPKRKKQS